MIKIWSSCSSVNKVITPEYCFDSGIDFHRYSSSNHLLASSELDLLNDFKGVTKQESELFLDASAHAAKGHLKDI